MHILMHVAFLCISSQEDYVGIPAVISWINRGKSFQKYLGINHVGWEQNYDMECSNDLLKYIHLCINKAWRNCIDYFLINNIFHKCNQDQNIILITKKRRAYFQHWKPKSHNRRIWLNHCSYRLRKSWTFFNHI